MFVGHYGVSFAAQRMNRHVPLWVLFIAVQVLDVFWAPFILFGIEKVRIVPGITASNPLDLYIEGSRLAGAAADGRGRDLIRHAATSGTNFVPSGPLGRLRDKRTDVATAARPIDAWRCLTLAKWDGRMGNAAAPGACVLLASAILACTDQPKTRLTNGTARHHTLSDIPELGR